MSNKDKRNGAFCNKLGEIYLRIASLDTEAPDWPMRVVDHGISLAEAHCIMSELGLAIHEASMHQTGRIPEINKEDWGTESKAIAERDELRKRNAKLRDIAERAVRSELDQIKEGAK